MRRIKDRGENESLENAQAAYENYSRQKHNRDYVEKFDADLDNNLKAIVNGIITEQWTPKGYKKKTIFEKKTRVLAKAPIEDHVTEATAIRPYEKQLYDFSTFRAPAVKPGLGTHAFLRMLRNELFKEGQEENMYYIAIDAHHYFPLIDHEILKQELNRKIKPGKLRRLIDKVINSYLQGIPLGIKVSQILGQIYLARFDRLAMNFFNISEDPEKLAYWSRKYVEGRIVTATKTDYEELSKGPAYLARKFRLYVAEGIPKYMRFVDNILIRHEDKTVLHIILELAIMHLARDWHVTVNKDYNVRPTWTGIRVCGYVFYHDRVLLGKANKQRLARKIHRLWKAGLDEESVRRAAASQLGYAKHVNCIHLFKKLGMEKTLGKIIRRRRVQSPFEGLNAEDKVKFSSICNYSKDSKTKKAPIKILLQEYKIIKSKIEKEKVTTKIKDGNGQMQEVVHEEAKDALTIRFKKIIKTYIDQETQDEVYICKKKKDKDGKDTNIDAEYYAYTGSRILIDQAEHDFSEEDLPCPTIIQQFETTKGQTFFKFT
ncbi:MAG: hypothetical protein LKE54_03755 [Prevotella sp.]|jgi:hypothetical protein|nr:hypothetical protein [Prevotella sp.]MCH3994162.1 hypothetical protein [Prevotella sp.]